MNLKDLKESIMTESKTASIKEVKKVVDVLDRIFSMRETMIDVPTQKRIDYIYKELKQLEEDVTS